MELMPSYINIGAYIGKNKWSVPRRPSDRARRSADVLRNHGLSLW